jgi:hypothetical protein
LSLQLATAVLDADARARLADLADVLIPAGMNLPSASEADVQHEWIDRVLTVRPDLIEPLKDALGEAGTPVDVLDRWQRGAPDVFRIVTFVIASAYFINPSVRESLGYPANRPIPNPALPDEADYYLRDGILDVVRERGVIYRHV